MINLITVSETGISMFRSPCPVKICLESLLVTNKSYSPTARAEKRYFFLYVLAMRDGIIISIRRHWKMHVVEFLESAMRMLVRVNSSIQDWHLILSDLRAGVRSIASNLWKQEFLYL